MSAATPMYINNVVTSASASSQLNLIEVTALVQGRYGGEVFPDCNSKMRETNCTINIFKSGKLGITGAKKRSIALLATYLWIDKYRRDFQIPLQLYNFVVPNIAASCNLGYKVNRNLFYSKNKSTSHWEPELFDGLFWKIENPNITYVIYENGKVIATGLTDASMIEIATQRLQYLKQYELGKESIQKNTPNIRCSQQKRKIGVLPEAPKKIIKSESAPPVTKRPKLTTLFLPGPTSTKYNQKQQPHSARN